MASLLSLPAELKLGIVKHLEATSTSFILTPPQNLVSLSQVCKVFRTLSLPLLLKSITLQNEERSGSSVLAILNSAYAEHVRNVHYTGIVDMPENLHWKGIEPSPEDFPVSMEQVLSRLTKLPNLKQVTVQFFCGRMADENGNNYWNSYDDFELLETEADEDVLESEKISAFRSLMEQSYRALSRNPASSIEHLELKNVVARKCSAWHLADFHALLQGLSSFTISLSGGDNGAGWQINTVIGYLEFVSELHVYFFRHLSNLKHFSFAATSDGPPGIEGAMRSIALLLLGQQMPQLQSLSLEYVFISEDLSAFIVAHSDTLESIRLDHCYSGWKRESATCWGDFFSSIASKNMKSLRTFNIAASDLE
jgi:hypothetical protein